MWKIIEDQLPSKQAAIVDRVIGRNGFGTPRDFPSLAVALCRALGYSWFIYRGGSHVAIHKASGESRLALIVQE